MYKIGMMTEYTSDFMTIKESLKMMKDLGYECADLTLFKTHSYKDLNPYFLDDDYKEKAMELKKYSEEIGLPFVQSHTPFPVYKFNDDEYNERMFNYQIRCLEICSIIGIKNVVIHPFNDFTDEENKDFFNRLLPYAEKYNVVICTENMWRWDKEIDRAKVCACSLPDSFCNTLKLVNSPNLKACVDVGHAMMFNHLGLTPRKLIEALSNNVYCLHIHDNDGIHDSHQIPFEGVIDYKDFVIGLKNINYKGDLIVETKLPQEYSKEEAISFFKKQLAAMNKIKRDIINMR